MRSSPKITRLQLKVNQNIEPVVVGIVSAEPDYKLSLALNRKLKISLRNAKPLKVAVDDGKEIPFSRFSDISSPDGLSYDLISNRNEKNFLIRKLKNIDFIFQIHNAETNADAGSVMSAIKDIDSVTAVFNIDIKSLKDKNANYIIQ